LLGIWSLDGKLRQQVLDELIRLTRKRRPIKKP
jgi:hypothetical protein